MNAAFITPCPGGVRLAVWLQPRASKNEIVGLQGEELKIKVTAPPVDSAANQALIDLLAEALDCPRGRIQITRGQTSRHKIVEIANLTAGQAFRALKTSS